MWSYQYALITKHAQIQKSIHEYSHIERPHNNIFLRTKKNFAIDIKINLLHKSLSVVELENAETLALSMVLSYGMVVLQVKV